MEAERIMDVPEGENEEKRALRILLGGRLLRKRRIRRLLLVHLLRQGDEIGDSDSDEGEDDERQTLRMLIGGRAIRSRKLGRLALAHLLREGDEDGEDDSGEDTGDHGVNRKELMRRES